MANNENDFEDIGGPEIRPRDRGSARVDSVETEPANPAPARQRNDPIPGLKLIDLPLDALRPAARRVLSEHISSRTELWNQRTGSRAS